MIQRCLIRSFKDAPSKFEVFSREVSGVCQECFKVPWNTIIYFGTLVHLLLIYNFIIPSVELNSSFINICQCRIQKFSIYFKTAKLDAQICSTAILASCME